MPDSLEDVIKKAMQVGPAKTCAGCKYNQEPQQGQVMCTANVAYHFRVFTPASTCCQHWIKRD